MSRDYSPEIVNVIDKYLTDNDWHYSFDDEKGFFIFNLTISSKINELHYVITVAEDCYTVYAVSSIGGDTDDPKMMRSLVEFITRANYGMRNGNFEMDMNDGEIRYKSFVDCEDFTPSDEVIANSIYCPSAMFKRYANGLLSIIFSDASAKEAVEKCEKDMDDSSSGNASSGDSPLRSMLEGMSADEIQDLLARLSDAQGGHHS